MMRVEVLGAEQVAASLTKLPEKLLNEFHREIGAKQEIYLNGLRSAIKIIVYDAYQPERYQRNFKLWIAANKELERRPNAVQFTLFNDTSRVSPTSPKGGSQPQDVPFEIEEGNWPTNWYGWVMPRPAYTLYAQGVMAPEINKVVDRTLETVLAA